MAEPTIDSRSSGVGAGFPPLKGEGSKTPPIPGFGLGAGTPKGGVPPIKPLGESGRPKSDKEVSPPSPKSPEEQERDALVSRSKDNLVSDLSEILEESKDLASTGNGVGLKNRIRDLVDALLEHGWKEDSLKKIVNKSGMSPKKFFTTLAKLIETSGEREAIDFLDKKLNTPEQGVPTPGALPSLGGGAPSSGAGGGPALPGIGGPPPIGGGAPPIGSPGAAPQVKANITDVDLGDGNFIMREGLMSKVIVKDGVLEKVSDDKKSNESLEKLVLAIKRTKGAISNLETQKLRYAGFIALRSAAEDDIPPKDDEDSEDGTEDLDDDLEDIGGEESEESGDVDKEKLLDGVKQVQDGIKSIEDAVNGVEGDMGEGEDLSPQEFGMTENLLTSASTTIQKAREVVKTAKKDIEKLEKKSKGKGKAKSKDSQKAMDVTMGKKSAAEKDEKKKEKDDKKEDKKEEKKDDKKDDKKASESDTEELIRRVKERLAKIRSERDDKEANLYPFKELQGPVEKVDNINETSAKQQASTANSEIKGQPVKDKGYPTINSELGQADLSYSTEGKSTEGKKVSSESDVANRVKNAIDKARLSVELAATQQLRGLLDNPLKEAFVKNMIEAGISEEVAESIAHNAFIDGYENSQKIIMKEAFDTFMAKPYNDFVQVAKFSTSYVPKENDLSSVNDEESKDKIASSVPLRGSKTDTHEEEYKNYWQQVKRNRRGF